MKKTLFLVCFLLLLACLALTEPVFAQSPKDVESLNIVQSFRNKFELMLDSYEVVFQRIRSTRGLELVKKARLSMQSTTNQELADLFAKSGVPNLSEAVRAAEGLVNLLPVAGAAPAAAPMSALPNAPPILGDCDNIVHTSSFTFGALIAFQAARTVLAAAEFACEEVVVVLGEGGNGAAACIPLAIAQNVAAIPYELASFCAGEEDSALLQGSYDRLGYISTELEAARIAIINNSNANRDLIIANANANREMIINELRALGCEILRLLNTPEGQRASSILSCTSQPGFPYEWPEKKIH
jgi:hypothetical protein